MSVFTEQFEWLERCVSRTGTFDKIGRVVKATGLIIESIGPEVPIGHMVSIECPKQNVSILAEVVGFREHYVLLMPLQDIQNVHAGCYVRAHTSPPSVPMGSGLIGRVLNGLGEPIDGKGPLRQCHMCEPKQCVLNPMQRQVIQKPMETGVRAIDTLLPLGIGQRMGIFSGSGVGKSTLIGMVAKGSKADVNVIALIGERGRELREFIEHDLGSNGLERSVVVIATSDESAAMRIRAANLATQIAEQYRDAKQHVLLFMDSVTRWAMARREIGLAIGEPPTARGYTPSVFALLPKLLERSGMGLQGSITALYTVLVDGDDMNEPIADAVRGILDGHIVLSRALAHAGHYPAIDILESISRLSKQLLSDEEMLACMQVRDWLALYKKNEDLINIGAYTQGTNAALDKAMRKQLAINGLLRQRYDERTGREEAFKMLRIIAS